jgi:PAS domain S-box-containing protein
MTPNDFYKGEDLKRVAEATQEVLNKGRTTVELSLLTKEGKCVPYEYSGVLVKDQEGNPAYVCAIGRDITERKRAEEELQKTLKKLRNLESIINRSPAMVFLWPIKEGWPVEFVSNNVKEVLGFTADDFISGKVSWPAITHHEDVPRLEAEIVKYLEEGITEFNQEYRLITKPGEVRWMSDRNMVLFDSNNTPTHIQSIVLDVTDQKMAEEVLKKREKELKIKTNTLEEVNTALRIMLKKKDEVKTEIEEDVVSNVKELVVPYLKRLKKSSLNEKQNSCLNILESNLNNITSSFSHKLTSKYLNLTPTEIRVANLIKYGNDTKEIADLLSLSTTTIESHRRNIRKKLGIKKKKTNLRTHLLSFS